MSKIGKKEFWKKMILLPAIVMIGALAGTILLVVAYALPISQSRLAETMITLEGQASYHSVLDMRNCSYFFSSLPGVLDTATDTMMIENAYCNTQEELLHTAMEFQDFTYYWHGYVVILRVLGSLFNYTDIRFLNFVFQFLIVFFFAQLLHKRKGNLYSFLFLSSYLLLMPVALYFSLQFSWIFYIAMGASFIILKWSDFWEHKNRYLYLFVAIGVFTCYFDLLTYPLVSWAYPIFWWILLSEKEKNVFSYVKQVVCSGLAWIFGYTGMWISKCIIGTWILGRNVFQIAAEEVLLRAGVEDQMTWHIRWETILTNLEHYKYKLYLFVFILWMIWFLYKVVFYKTVASSKIGALLLIGVSPLVWYVVLSNHTSVHHFFTYRVFNISVLALLGCMAVVVSKEKCAEKFHFKMLGRQIIHLGIVGLMVCTCTFFSREEVTYGNGAYYTKEDIQIVEGQSVTMDFYPSKPRITQFAVQFEPASESGELLFRLLSEKGEIYSREISFSEFAEEGIYYFDVDWNLTKREYEIQLEVQGEGASGIVYSVLTGGVMLEECGQVMQGEKQIPGQLILCVTYSQRALPQGADLIYTLLAWGFIILTVYFSVKPIAVLELEKCSRRLQQKNR